MKRQNLRTVSLIVVTFTYLLFGAAIFGYLESEHELRQREALELIELIVRRKYNISEDDFTVLTTTVIKSVPHRAGIQWKFPGAFYFATTVVTTIGYGHSTPATMAGRSFCMIYALIGIPLGLVMFQSIGERLNTFVGAALRHAKRCLKLKNAEVTQTNLVMVVLVLSTILMTSMAAVFAKYERWEYFDALYYCFITLTTIGFGDYVALQKESALQSKPEYVILSLIFILFGLSVVSSAVNLLVLKFLTLNTEDERRDEQLRYTATLNPIQLEGDVITSAAGKLEYMRNDKSMSMQIGATGRRAHDQQDYDHRDHHDDNDDEQQLTTPPTKMIPANLNNSCVYSELGATNYNGQLVSRRTSSPTTTNSMELVVAPHSCGLAQRRLTNATTTTGAEWPQLRPTRRAGQPDEDLEQTTSIVEIQDDDDDEDEDVVDDEEEEDEEIEEDQEEEEEEEGQCRGCFECLNGHDDHHHCDNQHDEQHCRRRKQVRQLSGSPGGQQRARPCDHRQHRPHLRHHFHQRHSNHHHHHRRQQPSHHSSHQHHSGHQHRRKRTTSTSNDHRSPEEKATPADERRKQARPQPYSNAICIYEPTGRQTSLRLADEAGRQPTLSCPSSAQPTTRGAQLRHRSLAATSGGHHHHEHHRSACGKSDESNNNGRSCNCHRDCNEPQLVASCSTGRLSSSGPATSAHHQRALIMPKSPAASATNGTPTSSCLVLNADNLQSQQYSAPHQPIGGQLQCHQSTPAMCGPGQHNRQQHEQYSSNQQQQHTGGSGRHGQVGRRHFEPAHKSNGSSAKSSSVQSAPSTATLGRTTNRSTNTLNDDYRYYLPDASQAGAASPRRPREPLRSSTSTNESVFNQPNAIAWPASSDLIGDGRDDQEDNHQTDGSASGGTSQRWRPASQKSTKLATCEPPKGSSSSGAVHRSSSATLGAPQTSATTKLICKCCCQHEECIKHALESSQQANSNNKQMTGPTLDVAHNPNNNNNDNSDCEIDGHRQQQH